MNSKQYVFCRFFLVVVIVGAGHCLDAMAGAENDWPMWGYDVSRRHVSPAPLPETPHLHWVLELPPPQRAWPPQMDDFEKLAFDASYEPVIAGGLLYVASMVEDSVTAYDVDTGEKRWRFIADGPVRMAPTVWQGRIFFVSDDGSLYCLDAESGAFVWEFRAAPSSRLVLGNQRFISMWPSRGGPVVYDGMVYFAAGIWPHEGVFIYALDAVTAEVVWENSRSASEIYVDAKRYYSFGGVTPQGQLVVSGDYLLVPGGRTVPAVFNRHTGEFLYLRLPSSTTSKGAGGHRVFAHGDWFFNVRDERETHVYALEDGAQHSMTPVSIADDEGLYGAAAGRERLLVYSADFTPTEEQAPPPEPIGEAQFIERGRIGADGRAPGGSDRMNSDFLAKYYSLERLWVTHVAGLRRIHLKAGPRVYGSGADGRIYALDVSNIANEPEVVWKATVSGEVFGMAAARDRLFVTTDGGRIYCFGPERRDVVRHAHTPEPLASDNAPWAARAARLLAESELRGGFGLLFGVGEAGLLDALLAQSDLRIAAFDPDPAKVAQLRARYMEAGLYGSRVSVHEGDLFSVQAPPYIADIIAVEDPDAAGHGDGEAFAQALFHPLRPYGGAAYLPLVGAVGDSFIDAVEKGAVEGAAARRLEDHVLLTRPGALPGAGAWTHQYADAANTAYSADRLVKAPLGVSWFGNVANHKTLPRHMHGPIPQVVGGRLILLGVDHISARCVYSGRELWAAELPLVGKYFTSLEHEAMPAPVYFPNHPGANFIGSPYVSAEDSIYLIHEDRCLRLDTATGAALAPFDMPDWGHLRQRDRDPVTDAMHGSYGARLQEGEQLRWGNLRYVGDRLIVAAYPHLFDEAQPGREKNWNATSSEFIVVMDRHNGAILWVRQARYGFRHNAIAAGADKLFVIDNLSEEIHQILRRRGIQPETEPVIQAFDLDTGALLWQYDDDVFGTSLSYSAGHDALVQSGHPGRRGALPDEPQDRLIALRGADGEALWTEAFMQRRSPLGIHDARCQLIASTQEPSVNMLTGERQTRIHPITGETDPWSWVGALRCGTQNYSEYTIVFRSGAAGVADLAHDSGTGQVAGFRPGCTNSMVVADGILNAPDYTRSCSCSYQLQTSLGLVHMPDVEWWVFNTLSDPAPGAIKNVAVNLGAPGSRFVDETDTLWVEYPMVGGPAPVIPIALETRGEKELFRRHSSLLDADNGSYRWVAASGVNNLDRLRLSGLFDDGAGTYTVRLHFYEPDMLPPGQRVFDIYLQGTPVETNMDVARETNGIRQGLVRSYTGLRLGDALQLELKPANSAQYPPTLSGIEVVWEG